MNGILNITINLLDDNDDVKVILTSDLSSNRFITRLIDKTLCRELDDIIPILRKEIRKELKKQGIDFYDISK
jgi:hypothetical protein